MEKEINISKNFDCDPVKDNLEQGNIKDNNTIPTENEDDSNFRPLLSLRERIKILLHSHIFQVAVIVLVILDCLLVIGELLLDVKIIELHEDNHTAPHVLHNISIGILSIFIVEIGIKIYAFGLEFFTHKLEIFDAVVVFVSFGLDIAFQDKDSINNGFGLVIVLRLWRVARILNGVVLSVKTQADHKLLKERRCREDIQQDLQKCHDYVSALEMEINLLRKLLKQHDIKEIPPTVVEAKTNSPCTIQVEAEVNQEETTMFTPLD